MLEGLALAGERLRLKSLWQIANSSEQLSVRARARIQAAFGVPVFDHYGIGECLFLSDGCPTDGGAHVNAEWAIVEVVDEDYRPVPPGGLGRKVLITNLANFAQPFIRYEVPDQVAWATEPCSCGNHLPRIGRIEGRSVELFWVDTPSGDYQMLPGVLFHSAMDAEPGIREWRAIQTERNRIELQVEFLATAENDFVPQRLVDRLHQFGLPATVQIDVESVVGLQPDRATGKYRRMIREVEAPAAIVRAPSAA